MLRPTNHRIVLASRPVGRPNDDNFRLEESAVRQLEPGELLLRTTYLSLDPYMRIRMNAEKSYAPPTAIGETMDGWGIADVIESRHPAYAVGDTILAPTRWQSHLLSSGTGLRKLRGSLPPTTALGVLGMPGFTAYAGLLEIGRPRPGETVVVAAATGPVGSAVGQIAKMRGARAIGIAGGKEKCRSLLETFGFDAALDHHDPGLARALAEACPAGIDVYFENVGGRVLEAVVPLLNEFARIPVCGLASQYNAVTGDTANDLSAFMKTVLTKSLLVRGFIQREFLPSHFAPFLRDMEEWVLDGSVRYREDIVEGLENAPAAFRAMLEGGNFGKMLVKV